MLVRLHPSPPFGGLRNAAAILKGIFMAAPKHMMLSLTLASAVMVTTPAMANAKTQEVRHADLDLSSAEGRASLQTRIRQAVKQVCSTPRGWTLADRQDRENCEAAAYLKVAPTRDRIVDAYLEKRGLAFDNRARVATN
jgi:UrcA family protein